MAQKQTFCHKKLAKFFMIFHDFGQNIRFQYRNGFPLSIQGVYTLCNLFCVSHINFGDTLNFIILTRARPVLIDYIIGSRIERKFMVFHKWNSTCVLESVSSAFGMYCVVHKSKFFYYTRLNPLDHDYTTTNYTKSLLDLSIRL